MQIGKSTSKVKLPFLWALEHMEICPRDFGNIPSGLLAERYCWMDGWMDRRTDGQLDGWISHEKVMQIWRQWVV